MVKGMICRGSVFPDARSFSPCDMAETRVAEKLRHKVKGVQPTLPSLPP